MNPSRITARIAEGLLRLSSLVLLAALALGVPTLSAQQPTLVGTWRGVDRGATVTLMIHPNGQYHQLSQSGTTLIRQAGPYRLVSSNRILFSPTNSGSQTPRSNVAVGGASTVQRAGTLGARNTINFKNPNRIVVTDEVTHHSVTLVRVP
jgi:hypothetical protein